MTAKGLPSLTAPLTVVKYGGASLGTDESFAAVVRELRVAPRPRVVVVSAREGVTDLLKGFLSGSGGDHERALLLEHLRKRHPGLPPAGESVLDQLERQLSSLSHAKPRRAGTRGARTTRASSSAATSGLAFSDAILAQGERLAAHWIAARLREEGLAAVPFEADRIGLATEGRHGDASVRLAASERPVRRALLPALARGSLPVVTGFFGRGPDGRVATLGRGGSDYTATALGYLLSAARVELVKKDVAILSADPRRVPGAQMLPRLSYEEAEELAQFGAKVLHPLTVEPARARGVEVVIRSLEDPSRRTSIGPALPGEGIRALTLLSPTALLLLRVPGGRSRRGVIAEVSRALAQAGVTVVTLFTSSALLLIVVEQASGRRARRALDPFARSDGASLEGPLPAGLVTAIGEGVLTELGGLPAEVAGKALGVSATSRTLSFAVPEAEADQALKVLHQKLVEERGRSSR